MRTPAAKLAPCLRRGSTCAPARGERGFTLVEAMITVGILVLAAAVVIPSLGQASRAELRSTAGKVAGTIRATYDSAALGGRSYRLAFDLDQQVVRVESDQSSVASADGALGLAQMMLAGGQAPVTESGGIDEVPPPRELLALFGEAVDEEGASGLAQFQNADHDLELPDDVRLMSVWVEGMSQPADKGTVYLQFFPHGYTDRALVHLTEEGGAIFTVKVSALTGTPEVTDSYVEAPQ